MRTEHLFQADFSLLILKPEFMLLDRSKQTEIWEGLQSQVGPNILHTQQKQLTRNQAEQLWINVKSYPWSGTYYDRMAQTPVTVLILEGQDRAKNTKFTMRTRFSTEIEQLTRTLNAGFSADIFHGSDPSAERREVMILGFKT